MDFLLGILVLGLLIPFNQLILKVVPKIHPLTRIGMMYFMLFGNITITLVWVAALHGDIKNLNSFVMGIGLATILNMGYKIVHLLLFTSDKTTNK